MTKKITATAKPVTFTAKVYGNRLDGLVTASNAIDTATASNAKAINAWAQMAAAGITANALTLDAVKEGIIAKYPKATTLGDCGNTIKGRFYAFQRIAGTDGALDRLIAGEALNAVARDCKPKQEQKTGKRGSGTAGKAKKLASLNDTLTALHAYLDTALVNGELAAELGNNVQLVALLPKLAKISAISDAYVATAKVEKRQAGAAAKAKRDDAARIVAAVEGRKAGKGSVSVRLAA
jgi:hypothetical protein